MNRPKATASELLEIQIEARENELRGLRADLRRTRRIERAADALLEAAGPEGYPATTQGLDRFADDLADECADLCSEEAMDFAPEYLTAVAS